MNKSLLLSFFLVYSTLVFSQETAPFDPKYMSEKAVFYIGNDGLSIFEHSMIYDQPKTEKEEITIVIKIRCNEIVMEEGRTYHLPDTNFVITVGVSSSFDNKVEIPDLEGEIRVVQRSKKKITLDLKLVEPTDELITQIVTFRRRR